MKSIAIIFLGLSAISWIGYTSSDYINSDKAFVQDVIKAISGEDSPNKIIDKKCANVEAGRSIVHEGVSSVDEIGIKRKQSKFFVCTSCHNIEKEFSDLTSVDAQNRLDYAIENQIPYLQGSSFYGIVNRTKYYNGDYDKKYGDLVYEARNDIRKSIQLCATECSQGRAMTDCEIESVLAYFWTLQYTIDDLALESSEEELIKNAMNGKASKEKAVEIIKSSYIDYSPATFIDPPVPRKNGREDYVGNPVNGEHIYKLSCLHCHQNERYSFYELDTTNLSYNQLAFHLGKYTPISAYQVIRYGTEPVYGRKAYMPHYTEEKLSKQQMEDLRAFILMKAGKEQ